MKIINLFLQVAGARQHLRWKVRKVSLPTATYCGGLQEIVGQQRIWWQAQKAPEPGPVPVWIGAIGLVRDRQKSPGHVSGAKINRSAICGRPIAQLMHR